MPQNNPVPSINEPVIDRYRKWRPIWYKWLKPLFDTVRKNTDDVGNALVQITTTNTVVDGVKAQWGVAITGTAGNEQVVGLVRLDGGVTGSTFTVVADKFIVAHPTTTDSIQAFIVGLVDGVSTVGINGNLIVDGTILARHIQTNTLSAISANLGTITAGYLQSADGNMYIDLSDANKEIFIGAS